MNKIIATSALAAVALSQDAKDANRRNLVNLLDHYNKDWDVSTDYWTNYGCNCRGDLDRQANGSGKAVDELDSNCKVWKQCLKCAECEDVLASKYTVRKRRGEYSCKDPVGTCERSICECDLQFAIASGEVAADWDNKKWGYNQDKCEKQQGGNFVGECCFNQDGLATWFNANKQCCSDDGALYELGTCV